VSWRHRIDFVLDNHLGDIYGEPSLDLLSCPAKGESSGVTTLRVFGHRHG